MREIPRNLWEEVLEVTTDIVWGPRQDNAEATSANMERLHAIYSRQNALGQPHPFLTEAVADFTEDASEAIALYRLALAESGVHPEEPTHTKRICLASRLIEIGDLSSARSELTLGREEAERLKDDEYLAMADDLLSKVPSEPMPMP
jgi:hypothetical protein